MNKKGKRFQALLLVYAAIAGTLLVSMLSCDDYYKNDYKDNSPTSGKLKVYYDEGLHLHVKNQAYTFESQYPGAHLELVLSSETDAIHALYNDSCEAIVISRQLNEQEKNIFASKNYFPKYSIVAQTAVALIVNSNTPLDTITVDQLSRLLAKGQSVSTSKGDSLRLKVLFDRNNSSVLHYMLDSVIKGKTLSPMCNSMNSTLDCINYIASNENTIGIIDFAWLSDVDDSLYKANRDKIRFVNVNNGKTIELPSQSTFKLGTYAFTRSVYVYRKTGEFSLAKGFESFVAGPKGQLTFLKQGLMPHRQAERNIEVNFEPMDVK